MDCSNNFVSIIVLDGELTVGWNDENVINAKKGDSIFIPNGLKIELLGKAQLLLSR